jgi:MFS family permease
MQARLITALTRPGAWMFALLWMLESFARSSIAAVAPVVAFDLAGGARNMTFMYTVAGAVSIVSSFAIPYVVYWLKPTRTYRVGAVFVALAPLVMALGSFEMFFIGFLVRIFALNCLAIGLSLFIMGYIHRRDMGRSEPLRMFLAAIPWTIGPSLGTWLYDSYGMWPPFILAAAMGGMIVLYVSLIRIDEAPLLKAVPARPANPIGYVPRFVRQPRLRLAYMLVFGRETWWWMFYLFVPVYADESGLGLMTGAIVLSLGSALVFFANQWGWVMRRIGMRRHMMIGFVGCGMSVIAAGAMLDRPWVAIGLILVSAIFLTSSEAAGNIPFLRAVRARERTEMSMVYGTYRDVIGLTVPGIYTILLSFFGLSSVFYVTGVMLFAYAWGARHIPKGM